MTEHVLKTIEPYWSEVNNGTKTFEVRRNDRAYQKGDTLRLLNPDDIEGHEKCDKKTCETAMRAYRGAIKKVVTFVYSGDPGLRDLGGIVPGYVVLGLGEPE